MEGPRSNEPESGRDSEAEPARRGTRGGTTPPRRATLARERHAAVRRANRSETAEDYVEAIESLVEEHGEARVRDLAACFGVSHVTVSRTVDRLQRDGLVETEPYRSIRLTDTGRAMARSSRERHAAVLRFLLALGVPPDVAQEDAEGIEHHVGPKTLAAFGAYVRAGDASVSGSDDGPGAAELASSVTPDPERFARVRRAHASELAEDYVEAIGDLIVEKGQARVGEIAKRFGVSHVTASRAIGRLQRDGLVVTEPYRPVRLTEKGTALARASRERHVVVLEFLRSLGIDPGAAEIDAEGVEHHVSDVTLGLFRRHLDRGGVSDDGAA